LHQYFVFWWRLKLSACWCSTELPHRWEKLYGCSFSRKVDRMKWKCGVFTSICWLHTFRFLPVGYSKQHCACHKTNNTIGPEKISWNYLFWYSTSNNTKSVPLTSTPLSTMLVVDILNICNFKLTNATVG
jgi:hypothetical protein